MVQWGSVGGAVGLVMEGGRGKEKEKERDREREGNEEGRRVCVGENEN